jgi:hypothetical protein
MGVTDGGHPCAHRGTRGAEVEYREATVIQDQDVVGQGGRRG